MQVLSDNFLLLCTEFEQVGSITGETAEQCMLFHINSFSATFLDLQYLGWYFLFQFMLSKVKTKAVVQEVHIKIR